MSIRERDAAYGRILAATQGEYATPDGDDRRTLLAALDALWEEAWVLAEEVHDERGERNPEHDSPLFRECSAESCVLNRAALAAGKEATDGR